MDQTVYQGDYKTWSVQATIPAILPSLLLLQILNVPTAPSGVVRETMTLHCGTQPAHSQPVGEQGNIRDDVNPPLPSGDLSFPLSFPPGIVRQLQELYRLWRVIGLVPPSSLLEIEQTLPNVATRLTLGPKFLAALFRQIDRLCQLTPATDFTTSVLVHHLTDPYPMGNMDFALGSPTNPGYDG